ncbi:MAG: hypothetical protein IJZ93_00370 [Clostridia bacterium]|nr:hypothetical protein [Clostridia bacterium]
MAKITTAHFGCHNDHFKTKEHLMRKSYKLLTKAFPVFMLELVVCAALGTIAFLTSYDSGSGWLSTGYVSIFFWLVVALTLATAIAIPVFSKDAGIVRFKDKYGFVAFAATLAGIIVFALFVIEFCRFVTSSNISVWRFIRSFVSIVVALNFIIEAVPHKLIKKYVNKTIRIILSLSSILWGVLSILSVYFDENVPMSNITKTMLLLTYVAITAFLLFEAEFKHAKKRIIAYTATASLAAFTSFSFCVPIALSLRSLATINFTVMEFVVCATIGLYALSKICSMIRTMHHVITTHQDDGASHHTSHKHHDSKDGNDDTKNGGKKEAQA